MAISGPIGFEDQLVLELEELYSPPKVAWFESWLEDEGCIGLWLWEVVRHYINAVVIGVDVLGGCRVIIEVVYNLFHKRTHHTDDLYVTFDGLLEDKWFWFVHWVLLLFVVFKDGILGKQHIINSPKLRMGYVLTVNNNLSLGYLYILLLIPNHFSYWTSTFYIRWIYRYLIYCY
jgi:hypothetical protein